MKYRVVNSERVEINGVVRTKGATLNESEFKPVPERPENAPPELSELESLLATGHIEVAGE